MFKLHAWKSIWYFYAVRFNETKVNTQDWQTASNQVDVNWCNFESYLNCGNACYSVLYENWKQTVQRYEINTSDWSLNTEEVGSSATRNSSKYFMSCKASFALCLGVLMPSSWSPRWTTLVATELIRSSSWWNIFVDIYKLLLSLLELWWWGIQLVTTIATTVKSILCEITLNSKLHDPACECIHSYAESKRCAENVSSYTCVLP